MAHFYTIARRVHRFCVLLIVLFGLVMSATGTLMKFALQVTQAMPFVDLLAARRIHNLLSPLFSIIFFTMMLSGGYMYIYPWLVKRGKQNKEGQSA
jgi:TRAP-type C4-dicarboxylate transport system permease small subunit